MPRKSKNPAQLCPLLKSECIEGGCKFWTHILGKNPQTGNAVDEFDCSIRFVPILLIEGAQQSRQAGAAIESFRNEVAQGNFVARQQFERLIDAAVNARPAALPQGGERDVTPEKKRSI